VVRLPYCDEFPELGGALSGSVMICLADYTTYVALLSRFGIVELTANIDLNVNVGQFLRGRG